MTRRSRLPLLVVGAFALAALISCGPPSSPAAVAHPTASAAPKVAAASSAVPEARRPDPPMPVLRTGALTPVQHQQVLEGRVVARHLGDVVETLAIEIHLPPEFANPPWGASPVVVALDGAGLAPYSFLGARRSTAFGPADQSVLWIRRARGAAGSPIAGGLFAPHQRSEPGVAAHFRADAPSAAVKSDPSTLAAFARAFGDDLVREPSSFASFAAERLHKLYPEAPAAGAKRAPGRRATVQPMPVRAEGELGRMMETTTGVASIQEALQSDRPLLNAMAREKASVPVGKLAPPKSEPHPWDELLASLPAGAAAEPLAAVTPAEFWFLRAASLDVVFRLADELDRWATPAVDALDGRAEERGLSARYEAELGIGRSAIARALGPEVVGEVALVGSDPYLREGSDLTAVFRVKSRVAFEAGLAASLAQHVARHGALTSTTTKLADLDVRVSTSADGAVRQHRATLDDLAFVSNSAGALERVLQAAKAKRARLVDEKDFRYLLARDAGVRADALGFMGDRFVGEVVGPRQKILEARRQLALAELETPPLAALLHGWLFGASPASTDALIKSGLLDKAELQHGRGGAITWKPGEAPRSPFGTPAALVPLIDQPSPELVTPAERDAYGRFARGYESYWSSYIDPALLRIALDGAGENTRMTADLRIMPLIAASEYRRMLDVIGGTRLDVPPITSGARTTLALGDSSRLRRELSQGVRIFSGRREVDLDWLGDWALLGVADRTPIAHAVHELEHSLPERPMTEAERETSHERDIIAEAASAPLYAAVAVRSPAAAALALAAARAVANDSLPGMLEWGELGKHRDVTIVRVAFSEGRRGSESRADKTAPTVTVYYALAKGALVVALDEQAIRGVIDDLVDGRGPKAAPRGASGGTQHVLDIALDKQGALTTVLGWLLEGEVVSAAHRSRAASEVMLRGAPETRSDPAAARALALAYFGAAPLTPDGGAYTLAEDGLRDPVRGSPHAPLWPALPVPGSPVAKLLGAVRAFRSELSVDREGPARRDAMQSLHVRVTLGLTGP